MGSPSTAMGQRQRLDSALAQRPSINAALL
jgi:hypothetical protein